MLQKKLNQELELKSSKVIDLKHYDPDDSLANEVTVFYMFSNVNYTIKPY